MKTCLRVIHNLLHTGTTFCFSPSDKKYILTWTSPWSDRFPIASFPEFLISLFFIDWDWCVQIDVAIADWSIVSPPTPSPLSYAESLPDSHMVFSSMKFNFASPPLKQTTKLPHKKLKFIIIYKTTQIVTQFLTDLYSTCTKVRHQTCKETCKLAWCGKY